VILLCVQCSRENSQPFRVGYIGSLTGKYSALGINARDGAILAVEDINAQGGIKGRPIEMILKDDQGNPEKAIQVVKDLADQGVRFLIGPFLTASGTRILPFINERGILTISGTIMGDNLENQDDYFIKLNPSTGLYGMKTAELFLDRGYSTLVTISDSGNDPYCTTYMAGFKSVVDRRSVKINSLIFDSTGSVSYRDIASRIEREDPQAVLICACALDTALISQRLKLLSPEILLASSPWGISEELIENGGEAVGGLLFFMSVHYVGTSTGAREFEDRFKSRFHQGISFASIFNYEALTMLAEGLRASPDSDPARVKEAILGRSSHAGVQADFRLDPEGDPIRPIVLHTIRDGSFIRAD
jgi:branched-chain amino acid transport system substrate-binding protein